MKKFIASEEGIVIPQFMNQILSAIPDYSNELEFFFAGFDHSFAQRDGVVEMAPGSFPELDVAKTNILEWENKFQIYLKEQEIRLK